MRLDRDLIAKRLIDILTSPRFSTLSVDPVRLNDSTSLLNDVVMDSIQLLEFIVEMERAFGFRTSSKDLTIDVFEQFGRVVEFVERSVAVPQTEAAGAPHA